MKNTMQKILLVCLLAAVSLSAFGCGGKKSEPLPVETISLEQTKQELTFDFKTGVINDPIPEQDAKEETEGSEKETVTSEKKETPRTNSDGNQTGTTVEDVTQVINVTDADGHGVTDAAGESVTDVTVVDTRVVEVPVTDTTAETAAETETEADGGETTDAVEETAPIIQDEPADNMDSYIPAYDTCKAYWLDMTKQGDYFFNGEFLTFTFQINEDIPDGSYPITISKTDIASWQEVRYYPEIINGEIAVNTGAGTQKDMSDTDFSLKVNSVEAKQGGTAVVTIDLANNPGFCGFVIDVQYDANAMSIVRGDAGRDYDQAVNINN